MKIRVVVAERAEPENTVFHGLSNSPLALLDAGLQKGCQNVLWGWGHSCGASPVLYHQRLVNGGHLCFLVFPRSLGYASLRLHYSAPN